MKHFAFLIAFIRCFSLENKELSSDNPIKKILNHHQIEISFFVRRVLIIYGLMFCNKIYFLGFAFHQQNCDLLQLKNFYQNREVFWTNFDASIAIDNKVDEIFSYQKIMTIKNFIPLARREFMKL